MSNLDKVRETRRILCMREVMTEQMKNVLSPVFWCDVTAICAIQLTLLIEKELQKQVNNLQTHSD